MPAAAALSQQPQSSVRKSRPPRKPKSVGRKCEACGPSRICVCGRDSDGHALPVGQQESAAQHRGCEAEPLSGKFLPLAGDCAWTAAKSLLHLNGSGECGGFEDDPILYVASPGWVGGRVPDEMQDELTRKLALTFRKDIARMLQELQLEETLSKDKRNRKAFQDWLRRKRRDEAVGGQAASAIRASEAAAVPVPDSPRTPEKVAANYKEWCQAYDRRRRKSREAVATSAKPQQQHGGAAPTHSPEEIAAKYEEWCHAYDKHIRDVRQVTALRKAAQERSKRPRSHSPEQCAAKYQEWCRAYDEQRKANRERSLGADSADVSNLRRERTPSPASAARVLASANFSSSSRWR